MKKQKTQETGDKRSRYDFSVCPTCKGEGRIIVKKKCPEVYGDDYEVECAEPCPTCNGGHFEKVEEAKRLSDIPSVYYDTSYDCFNWNIYIDESGKSFDLSKKRIIVEDFLRNYKKWRVKGLGLYIHSKTKGSGKTFLASCLCNELMELYAIKTRFVRTTDLLEISKSGDQDSPDEYKREPIKLLCNCELLVLDDIGQKKTGYDWMNEVLFRIIDDRVNKGLVTVFTSNLDINELTIDERIKERINKMSVSMSLPEFNVRSRSAYEEKAEFIKEILSGDGHEEI